jgi:hypothetical protein
MVEYFADGEVLGPRTWAHGSLGELFGHVRPMVREALVGKSHLQGSLFKLLETLQEHHAARESEASFSLARESYECRLGKSRLFGVWAFGGVDIDIERVRFFKESSRSPSLHEFPLLRLLISLQNCYGASFDGAAHLL